MSHPTGVTQAAGRVPLVVSDDDGHEATLSAAGGIGGTSLSQMAPSR
jgi:hypothetical protein